MRKNPLGIAPRSGRLERAGRRGRAIGALALAALAGSCADSEAEGPFRASGSTRSGSPRLVVLYSTCTLSKDFLSPYRDGIEFTPNLAAFAAESMVFERHVSEAGQSGVAFASIYTGTQADEHGVFHHPTPLPSERVSVTEAFLAAGYEPHFWSGQPMASAELDYGQGVPAENTYDTSFEFSKHAKALDDAFFTLTTATGAELDAVLAELAADPSHAAFLQINFTITHELYHEFATPDRIELFRERFPEHATRWTAEEIGETLALFEEHRHVLQLDHGRALARLGLDASDVRRIDEVLRLAYKACVHQLDEYFGRFVEKVRAAGLLDESVIAFTADHGETFHVESEELHWMHGLQLAPTVVEVPWIVRAPGEGVEAGRYGGVSRSVDVYPTLAGLAGFGTLSPADGGPSGTDLAGALRGAEPAPRQLAFLHTTTLGDRRIRRYTKNDYRGVLDLIPRAEAAFMRVAVRDVDLVVESRPRVGDDGTARGFDTFAFDLAVDRERRDDVFDPANAEHAALAEELVGYRARLERSFHPTEAEASEDALRALAGLGYMGEDEAPEQESELGTDSAEGGP